MNIVPFKEIRIGDELTMAWLNALRDTVLQNQITLGANCGLAMTQSPAGTALRVSSGSNSKQLAVTDGAITARSGTTAGTGTVFLTTFDGTDITTTAETLDVFNFSSTTGGIATGTYVWVQQDDGGNYWITAVDCGN